MMSAFDLFLGRFLNHSCDPNAYTKVVCMGQPCESNRQGSTEAEGDEVAESDAYEMEIVDEYLEEKHIVIFASRNIR